MPQPPPGQLPAPCTVGGLMSLIVLTFGPPPGLPGLSQIQLCHLRFAKMRTTHLKGPPPPPPPPPPLKKPPELDDFLLVSIPTSDLKL